MTYSEPNYFPQQNMQNRYGSYRPQRVGTDGFAIAAFVLAFIPGLITFVLTITFATKALGRIRYSRAGGRGLAIASFWVTASVNALVIVLAIALAVPSSQDARYVASVDYDVAATVGAVKTSLQTNPQLDIASVQPVSHGDNVIKITVTAPGSWSVRGYSTKFGDPDRDFEDWTSWSQCGCLNLHGAYQRYYSYLQENTTNAQEQSAS